MSALELSKIIKIQEELTAYSNFPKEGIKFWDIFSLTKDPSLFRDLISLLKTRIVDICPDVDVIVGLEARGFLLGPVLSLELKRPFVPVRKKGKLPGKVSSISYDLEYGQDIMEIQEGMISPGDTVVIIDDLVATGGTMSAACKLITELKGNIGLCLVCIELPQLNGQKKIGHRFESLLKLGCEVDSE